MLKQLHPGAERKGCRVIEKIRVRARVRARVRVRVRDTENLRPCDQVDA